MSAQQRFGKVPKEFLQQRGNVVRANIGVDRNGALFIKIFSQLKLQNVITSWLNFQIFILTCRTRFFDVLTLKIPIVFKPFSSRYFVHAKTIEGTCWTWLWTPGMSVSSSSSWLLLRSMLVWKSGENVLWRYSASVLAGRDSHDPELTLLLVWWFVWSKRELNELRELLVSFFPFDRFWSFSMHCSSGKLNTRPPEKGKVECDWIFKLDFQLTAFIGTVILPFAVEESCSDCFPFEKQNSSFVGLLSWCSF